MIDNFELKETRFLSNFYLCDIEYLGKIYPSIEHAYQSAKTEDESKKEEIRLAKTPGISKKLGQKVKLVSNWDRIKLSVMEELLRKKFNQEYFKDKLLSTGDNILIEGNWWGDRFWGMYIPQGVGKGEGQNHLGQLLMKIRDELKDVC